MQAGFRPHRMPHFATLCHTLQMYEQANSLLWRRLSPILALRRYAMNPMISSPVLELSLLDLPNGAS